MRRSASGFTLVELVAALGISLLLVAAVSASLDIYVRVTTAGQQAIERQQVARALLDQMTRDVASIVFRPVEAIESTEDDTSMSVTTQSSNADSTMTVGLVGTAQTLSLDISRPQRNLQYEQPQLATSPLARSSDLFSVFYFLAVPGGEGLSGLAAERYMMNQQATANAVDSTSASLRSVIGLGRAEFDLMAFHYGNLGEGDEVLAEQAQVIAPEIATLQFRYFDGSTWVDDWDSVSMGALPRAIEVTIGFRDGIAEARLPSGLSSLVPIAQTIRHVILVPMSAPASATEAL